MRNKEDKAIINNHKKAIMMRKNDEGTIMIRNENENKDEK